MRWSEALRPLPMSRVAVVAPAVALRRALTTVADAGVVEFERSARAGDLPPGAAARALQRLQASHGGPGRSAATPLLSVAEPDVTELIRAGRADLLAGEAELAGYRDEAVAHGRVAALIGWAPAAELPALTARLAPVGAAVVPLPAPRGVEPPTLASPDQAHRAFDPLVAGYSTVPYPDIDPTLLAGLAYLVMFGAMFGDAGHGTVLLLGALLVRSGRPRRLAALRPHWPLIAGAGISSIAFGLLYGECFGPTGLVPTLWLAPLDHPVPLLLAGVGLGAVLLAGSFLLGTVNRVREGGWVAALYAPSGLAGSVLFLAAGLAVLGWYAHLGWAGVAAVVLAAAGLGLAYVGLFAGSGGGAAGALQAGVELFDVVIRIGANVVSFARLAAFGLTHAVLAWIVWDATTALWQRGGGAPVGAAVLFLVGNALAFGLEALVAGVQALRLEYYELFSRVFQLEGRPFRPWHVPVVEPDPVAPAASR